MTKLPLLLPTIGMLAVYGSGMSGGGGSSSSRIEIVGPLDGTNLN